MSRWSRRWRATAIIVAFTGLALGAGPGLAADGSPVAIYTAGISAGSGPNGIAVGPDGAMWFTEYNGDHIGRISASGSVTEEPASASPQLAAGANPAGIVADGGDLYFSEFQSGGNGAIGEIAPSTGQLVGEYQTPTAGSEPDGITVAGDGALWFAEQGTAGRIGRLDPASHAITEYSVLAPNAQAIAKPTDLVSGPGGALWITLLGTGQVARLDPSASPGTDAGVTLYDLPSGVGAHPEGITVGPDGDLFVAEYGDDQVAQLDPSELVPGTSDGITEHPVGAAPLEASTGADGLIWLTEPDADQVVALNPATGTLAHTLGSSQGIGGEPTDIASDGADHLYFTEFTTPAVGGSR